jgi:hypothetical protein
MHIVDHGDGLATVEGSVKIPGMALPARTTLLSLEGGGLAVISPLVGLSALADDVRARGEVRALVAPSLLHHLGLPEAKQAFEGARVLGPRGLEKKQPGVPLDEVLEGAPSATLGDAVAHMVVRGLKPSVSEIAFFHRPSKTLVLTDLCFHVNEHESLWGRAFMRMNGAWRRFGVSRLMRRTISDRAALRSSTEALLALAPERVVVAHGDIVHEGAAQKLAEAFRFLAGRA